jgi:hypothetical protein
MKTTIRNANGELVHGNKHIPVLNWELSVERIPQKVKFLCKWKKKLPKNVFIDSDGSPTMLTWGLTAASGSATLLRQPTTGEYKALFTIKGKRKSVAATVIITEWRLAPVIGHFLVKFVVSGDVTMIPPYRRK